ncbi:MAG: FtsK/SpoIIIE domain-containing protein [Lachnospiraceae bacterium]
MSTILTVYSNQAFKRYLLPAINDADYSIGLSCELFQLSADLELKLEVTGGVWRYAPSDAYNLRSVADNKDSMRVSLTDAGAVRLLVDGNQVAALIARKTDTCFTLYTHCVLSGIVTIGTDSSSTISLKSKFLSPHHAAIEKVADVWHVRDMGSRNGTYLNGRRVADAPLSFGDIIDIFGLRIVFLGSVIAVNETECGAFLAGLQRAVAEDEGVEANAPQNGGNRIFHRSPRRIPKLESSEITIDDPPQPVEKSGNQTILSVIGSVIAMSLPMLVGCAFMVYASNQAGSGSSAFMMIGAVTAVTSAVIGLVRGITGMQKAREQYASDETRRNQKYGEYLKEREAYIGGVYSKDIQILKDNYFSASECAGMTGEDARLWSRNTAQEDFLNHRLGIGDVPFPCSIKVPQKRFTMVENRLMELPLRIRDTYETMHEVPVCIDLLRHRLIGVVGGEHMTGGIEVVRDLVCQIAANNCYTEVKLCFIYDSSRMGVSNDWDFVRWLPHVWNETETFRYVASTPEEASDVFYELNARLRARMEEKSNRVSDKENVPVPYYILVLVNPELISGELISRYILNPDPCLGLTTLYMTKRYEDLPNECSYIIENDNLFHGVYSLSDLKEERIPVTFDHVEVSETKRLAESLAGVRVRETESGGDIPGSVTFFEMYGIHSLSELNVLNRWKKNRTYETMKALIGQKEGGAPCYLDIHEKYHGPHGLVAGTTGSGKSETLQTYILSLAINFSPDDVSFFIIDYKGGGMAQLFESLPHMIGQISNLAQGNQIYRALVSLQAEKDRREAIFKEYGVKDIRDYTRLYKNNETPIPLPHLIIVIDEFAEMKHDAPEFIDQIVSISRVGRSLGIHLIMATQKPAGSVSEDIWSNSRFKLCLRVQSKQDSMDMLHKPDAAYLTRSGRCYLQVGNDELYELFQSGFSGAPYTEEEEDGGTDLARMLNTDGVPVIEGKHAKIVKQRKKKVSWISKLLVCVRKACGDDASAFCNMSLSEKTKCAAKVYEALADAKIEYEENEHNTDGLITLFDLIGKCGYDAETITAEESSFTNSRRKLPEEPQKTQLEAVVEYLKATAEQNGYNHDFSLFLPLLPEHCTLQQLPQAALPWNENTIYRNGVFPVHEKPGLAVSMGLFDDPKNQRQDTVVIDCLRDGNVAVYGMATSGRTTFLLTYLYSLSVRYSPAEVNYYVFEYSARKFTALEQDPHCGGILHDADENDRVDKFFTLLSRILAQRKKILQDVNFTSYLSIHGAGSLPAVVVAIDNLSSLRSRTQDRYNDFLIKLLKEGLAYGIYFICTAGGTGANEMPSSMGGSFGTVFCLECSDPFEYGSLLRETHLQLTPEPKIKGRGLCRIGKSVLEFQTALPFESENDLTMAETIRNLAQDMDQNWSGDRARSIPQIPEKPTADEFLALPEVRNMHRSGDFLALGYDLRFAEPYGIDLTKTYSYIISGGRKKGKTNTLKMLMLSAARLEGSRLFVIDFGNHLGGFAEMVHAEQYISDADAFDTFFEKTVIPLVKERNVEKKALAAKGLEDDEIYRSMQKFEKVFFFVDQTGTFLKAEGHDHVAGWFRQVIEACQLHNIYWFFAIDRQSARDSAGYAVWPLMVADHTGLHLGGDVYGSAVPDLSFDSQDRKRISTVLPVGDAMIADGCMDRVKEVIIPNVRSVLSKE